MRVGAYSPGFPNAEALDAFALGIGRPDIAHYYRDFGDTLLWAEEEAALRAYRAAPMVTVEPWGVPLSDIAGGRHDEVLVGMGEAARKYGDPFMIRFAHEFNGDWYPWCQQPQAYREAFRRVSRVVRSIAPNARMVWCPNRTPFEYARYWPGPGAVQWMGVDGYNWNDPWKWPGEVFRTPYKLLTELSDRPIVIAETSCAEAAADKKAMWIRSAFRRVLPTMPQIRAASWFDKDMRGVGQQDWRINSSSSSRRAFSEALRESYDAPLFKGWHGGVV